MISPTFDITDYLTFMEQEPDLFQASGPGTIEVLRNPDEIRAAQQAALSERRARGVDTTDLRVGLIARDPYMTIVRDAVRFPDGSLGLHNRVIEGEAVAVLPLLNGRPVLLRIFRHGMRDWSLEFPRGAVEGGETPEAAAHREIREEIDADILELIPLGLFTPGGSSLTIRGHFFAARIGEFGKPDRAEGIDMIDAVSVAEVEQLVRTSRIVDGFSLSIFLRARLHGLV